MSELEIVEIPPEYRVPETPYPEIEYDWDEEPPEVEFECTSCGRCCVSPEGVYMAVPLKEEDIEATPLHILSMMTRPDLVYGRLTNNKKHPDGVACVAFRGRVGKKCGCAIYEFRPWNCRHFHPGSRCLEFLKQREEIGRNKRERLG